MMVLGDTRDNFSHFKFGAGNVAQLMECLPSIPRALGWFPASHNLSMVEHAFNSGTWVVEAGRSKTQGHPLLRSEFETSLGYIIPVFPPTKIHVYFKVYKSLGVVEHIFRPRTWETEASESLNLRLA